jgi:hypothetical protein
MSSSREWINDVELRERTGLGLQWLRVARMRNSGPPFKRFGRRVLYHWPSVQTWLSSQPGGGDVMAEKEKERPHVSQVA